MFYRVRGVRPGTQIHTPQGFVNVRSDGFARLNSDEQRKYLESQGLTLSKCDKAPPIEPEAAPDNTNVDERLAQSRAAAAAAEHDALNEHGDGFADTVSALGRERGRSRRKASTEADDLAE